MTEQYYKHYTKCKVCGKEYGYDSKKDDGRCPECWAKLHGIKSMFGKNSQN
jgi:DNA-directed RNA polymerase subunit RPC12/RpoP